MRHPAVRIVYYDREPKKHKIEEQKCTQEPSEGDGANVRQGLILSSPHEAKEFEGIEHAAVEEDEWRPKCSHVA